MQYKRKISYIANTNNREKRYAHVSIPPEIAAGKKFAVFVQLEDGSCLVRFVD